MAKLNLISQSAIVLALAWPSLTQAGIDLSEMDKLAARRTDLNNRETAIRNADSKTADISTQFAAIRSIQSEMIVGPKGLKKDVEGWLTKADAWIAQWKIVAQASTLINRDSLGSFGTDIQEKLQVLNQDYFKLAETAMQITDKSVKVGSNLKGRPLLQEANWPQYQDFVRTLNVRHNELIATVETLSSELDANRVQTLQKQMNLVSDYIIAQITLLAIQFPELRQQVEDCKAIIQFGKEVDPKLVAFEYRLNQAITMVSSGFLYTAKETEAELVEKSTALLKDIADFPATETFRKSKSDRVSGGLKRFQDNLKAKQALGSPARALSNLAKTERPRLTALCRANMGWSGVNCELLRVLNSVDTSFIKLATWKVADLAFFEKQLFRAGQGSTIINTGAGQ